METIEIHNSLETINHYNFEIIINQYNDNNILMLVINKKDKNQFFIKECINVTTIEKENTINEIKFKIEQIEKENFSKHPIVIYNNYQFIYKGTRFKRIIEISQIDDTYIISYMTYNIKNVKFMNILNVLNNNKCFGKFSIKENKDKTYEPKCIFYSKLKGINIYVPSNKNMELKNAIEMVDKFFIKTLGILIFNDYPITEKDHKIYKVDGTNNEKKV